jgi:hypothetical protein
MKFDHVMYFSKLDAPADNDKNNGSQTFYSETQSFEKFITWSNMVQY